MQKKINSLFKQLNQHWVALVIAALFFLLASIYSLVTPIFESPDELWHYPFVWHLAQTGQLPVQNPAAPQLWRQEGSQPPLYYALAALLTAPIPADDLPALIYPNPHADIGLVTPDGNINIVVHTARERWPWRGAVLAIHLARFVSVSLGVGTVLTVYALGRMLWPERPALALLAMTFVAFNPMFLFIAGSVNNDNLITLLASLVLWRLISIVVAYDQNQHNPDNLDPPNHSRHFALHCLRRSHEPALGAFITLGLLIGLAALTKVSGLGLLVLVGLTLLLWGLRRRSGYIAIVGNSLVSLCAIVVAGWWYWRNFRLYGDWTGVENMIAMMGGRPVSPTAELMLAEIPGLARSFWGLFGYFSIPMPDLVYSILNVFLLIGLLGLLLALVWPNPITRIPIRLRRACPILSGWLMLMLAALLQWTLRTPATQGRLLFPALAALALLWAAGWLTLSSPYGRLLPPLSMFVLALWIPWGLIRPAYAPPAPISRLPSSAHLVEATFGHSIELLAYELQDDLTLTPGQMLPLTLYWRSLKPVDIDYTVFIHLVDQYDLIIAQRDLFHGSGLYPTSQWLDRAIFRDRYVLHIPRGTLAPTQAHFVVGLYNQATGLRLPLSTGEDHIRFGQVTIQPHPGPWPNPQELLFEDGIALVGYALTQRLVSAGDQLTLALYWQGRHQPTQNYKVFVHLVGPDNIRIAQHDSEPNNGAAPTAAWQAGQIVLDEHPLIIAATAPPGAYYLLVGLYQGDTGRRLRLLRNDSKPVQADAATLAGVRIAPHNNGQVAK